MTQEQINSMLSRVDQLGNGDKALLRRNAAVHYERTDFRAAGAFLRLLTPDTPAYEEAPLFAAVCIRCLWKTPGSGQAFPTTVATLKRQRGESETVEKRFLSLLDEPLSVDSLFSIKLYRLSHMLCAAGIEPDWPGLCADLIHWNHPERFVQRRWMRTYFHVPDDSAKENE